MRSHQETTTGRLAVNEGATIRDQAAAVDDESYVVVDTKGQQINPLRVTLTVAEVLDHALGQRRSGQ